MKVTTEKVILLTMTPQEAAQVGCFLYSNSDSDTQANIEIAGEQLKAAAVDAGADLE